MMSVTSVTENRTRWSVLARHAPEAWPWPKGTRPAGDTASADTNLIADLHVSPTTFGVIMGVGGAGSLAGALLAPRIASRIGIGPTINIGFAVSPLAQIPLLLAGPRSPVLGCALHRVRRQPAWTATCTTGPEG